jgi:acetyl esterase/lipase
LLLVLAVAAVFADKRPISHNDYDSWRNIQNQQLSRDGQVSRLRQLSAGWRRRGHPIFMADRVRTPIMMLHNDADDAVPWYQGIEYYLALRRLGKEANLFVYNGEPHGLRRRPNQKDYTVRLQQYFDHFLKGAPKPDWMERGIPYLESHPAPAGAVPPEETGRKLKVNGRARTPARWEHPPC